MGVNHPPAPVTAECLHSVTRGAPHKQLAWDLLKVTLDLAFDGLLVVAGGAVKAPDHVLEGISKLHSGEAVVLDEVFCCGRFAAACTTRDAKGQAGGVQRMGSFFL